MADDNRCIEDRLQTLEEKVDQVMELVVLGKHLMYFAKFLGWCGGAYLAVETYVRTFLTHK